MQYGLIIPEVLPEHYQFGDAKLGDTPVNPSGDWTQWLPVPENQNVGLEPMACTIFALLNCVETMLRQRYGTALNLSDRFLAYVSGTTKFGNDPHKVAETLRTGGDVLEADYPYTPDINTWELFYSKPARWLYTKALEFIAEYSFGHSWVTNPTQQRMMEALTYSPLSAGVHAWTLGENGYYIRPAGAPSIHDVMIYGFNRNNYWLIFDSYDQNIKKLAWDFGFDAVKRYTLDRQIVNQTAWEKFLTLMQGILDGMKLTFGLGDFAQFGGVARSPQWPKVRADFIKTHPTCAVCGGTKDLNVHHRKPYHLHPELELDQTNLITLCNHGLHHIWIGHLGNFQSYNVNVEHDAAHLLEEITTRP